MEREVGSLTARSGIHMNWAMSTDPQRTFEQIAVVTLLGVCRPEARIPAPIRIQRDDFETLGQTQVVDGQIQPFAELRCDAVRRLIFRDLISKPREEREEFLGRALGRVMAHELYHVVLRTTSHGRNGLARESQTSKDLMADHYEFAPADERKLSHRWRGELATVR
jgi:hypothetical protein